VRPAALIATAVLALAGCMAEPEPDSGIQGTALLGPTCPNLQDPPEPECNDRPYEGDLVVMTPDQGRVVERFSTNAHGEFRVAVPPGRYSIRNEPGSAMLPACSEQQAIVVVAHAFTAADVHCDTGIR
jgi:hypothetical protein